MHILLSSDIHPNSDLESLSLSVSPDEQNTSIFNHNLCIIQFNIQSLVLKLDILEPEMQFYDTPVFTGTWLKPETRDDDLRIFTYDIPYRKDRTDLDLEVGVPFMSKQALTVFVHQARSTKNKKHFALKSYLKVINFLYVVYIDHQTQQKH